jgi:integrase
VTVPQPLQKIDVFAIQDRRDQGRTKPWVVRWRVDGNQRARSFRVKAEADRYRSVLSVAVLSGERFDPKTGEPLSWTRPADDPTLFEWARRWLAEQWPEWQPRTRNSAVEVLTRFLPIVVELGAPEPSRSIRAHLKTVLVPTSEATGEEGCARWLQLHSPRLSELTKPMLARADVALGIGDDGNLLGSATAQRFRKLSHGCIRRAVELDLLPADPWPPAPRGRKARKVVRRKRSIDPRALPDPATMRRILAAMSTRQPASRTYRLMTAVVYYAGLRPSEVVMLRPSCLTLPLGPNLWGRIEVREADVDNDTPGDPKTGRRSVPIPPVLVAELRLWLMDHDFGLEDLIFRTRTGRRPASSNWNRAWHRTLGALELPAWRIYDCRHAAATTWLASGAPLGEVARRLGHSVDTLVSTYVGALVGDEEITNQRIACVLKEGAA